MSVKVLTEQHLEFLRLKGGCTGSSESTLVKMPHFIEITLWLNCIVVFMCVVCFFVLLCLFRLLPWAGLRSVIIRIHHECEDVNKRIIPGDHRLASRGLPIDDKE